MFVCTNDDLNMSPVADPKPPRVYYLREEILHIWGIVQMAKSVALPKQWRELDLLMWYGSKHYSRKKRMPVDVQALITAWKDVVVVLATAHDKDAIDAAEFKMDELLSPLLTAPVAQLREFHQGLTEALRNDPKVPFFIWSMFNAWGKGILEKCESKPDLIRLRKKLAGEIADMVNAEIRPDIATAVQDALKWRDPETLQAIKSDLQAGAKPRLKGRESCLFLVTKKPGRGQKEHKVML